MEKIEVAIQSLDFDNVEYDEPDRILKILKKPISSNPLFKSRIEKRFEKEISSLSDCNQQGFENVVEIFQSGNCKIGNHYNNQLSDYLYYTMEYAQYDLRKYIEQNSRDISLEEKIDLCVSLSHGLNELFSLGYYHRDLKPDNIFMTENGGWKIGDLGLIGDRNSEIDKTGDFIGPRGWISPEAMNKFLCEGKDFPFKHHVAIDHQSDIFQLGKVFWYIFQHNAPIGCIGQSDFQIKNDQIYILLKTMLNYSRNRRYKTIIEVINLLKRIQSRLLKVA